MHNVTSDNLWFYELLPTGVEKTIANILLCCFKIQHSLLLTPHHICMKYRERGGHKQSANQATTLLKFVNVYSFLPSCLLPLTIFYQLLTTPGAVEITKNTTDTCHQWQPHQNILLLVCSSLKNNQTVACVMDIEGKQSKLQTIKNITGS